MRGHNLLWNRDRWLPDWLRTCDFGATPSAESARLVAGHIRKVIGRHGAQVRSRDVVNEAVRPADRTSYGTVLWRATGGAEPVPDLAFHLPREAAPTAQLVYNDYMGWEPGSDAHRAGVLRLLERFRRRGMPVDALGLQSHLTTQPSGDGTAMRRQQAKWRRFLDAVAAVGLDLLVTELDVRDDHLPADPAIRDRGLADDARAFLDVTLAQPRTGDVPCRGCATGTAGSRDWRRDRTVRAGDRPPMMRSSGQAAAHLDRRRAGQRGARQPRSIGTYR